MKNKFLEPSVEVLKFSCETSIEGSPDTTTDGNGPSTEIENEDIFA